MSVNEDKVIAGAVTQASSCYIGGQPTERNLERWAARARENSYQPPSAGKPGG